MNRREEKLSHDREEGNSQRTEAARANDPRAANGATADADGFWQVAGGPHHRGQRRTGENGFHGQQPGSVQALRQSLLTNHVQIAVVSCW